VLLRVRRRGRASRLLRRGVTPTKQEAAKYGPVQIIVIGSENPEKLHRRRAGDET
jgi:hypothetical protein